MPVPYYLSTHAAVRLFRELAPSSLCGKMARDHHNLTTDWGKVTCWHCRLILKQRHAREAAHG